MDWLRPGFEGFQAARVGLSQLTFGFLNGPFLLEENQVLRNRLAAAMAHEEIHRELFEENGRLRALIGFKKRSPWAVIPAQVIGQEMGFWSRTLLLDKGTLGGVKVGMAVITPVGLVGRISEVGEASSRAILVTDPHFRVSATLASSRISGLVTGTSSGECLLTYLPVNAELKEEDKVFTSGGTSFCPEGILIGSVGKAQMDPSKLFLSARIHPAVQAAAVEEVLVLRRESE